MLSPPGVPTLEEPGLVTQVSAALSSSPMVNPGEEVPSLAGERHDLASPAGAVEHSCTVRSIDGSLATSQRHLQGVFLPSNSQSSITAV